LAKTHKTEIVAIDTIEHTLEEEDKLSADAEYNEKHYADGWSNHTGV
jgi:hypothetical protein